MKKTGLLLLTLVSMAASRGQFLYPAAPKEKVVDNYHGTAVPDPYRWMEDENNAQTKKWVEDENKLTFGYLEKIPYRDQMKKRIEEVYNYPKYGAPFRRGEFYYFYKNDGLQNQSVLYRQRGLNGAPEVVIDPNKLSADGTEAMGTFSLSKDGNYAVYGISKGGSDWQTYYVMDMKTLSKGTDELKWVKVSSVAWQGNGFYYSRYPAPAEGKELSSKNENHQVWYHKIGTPQADDQLVYEDKANPQRFHTAATSEDEKYLFLYISDRGKGKDGNAVYFKTLEDGSDFKKLIEEPGEFSYSIVDPVNGKFLVSTNDNAPNRKLVLIDPANKSADKWITVIPEKKELLQSVNTAGGRIFANYLKDVTARVYMFDKTGKSLGEVKMPGLGTVGGFGGREDDKLIFYTFSSFTYPPTIFSFDPATGQSKVFRKPEVNFNPAEYETKQVFYPSKDGTKVPMFIVAKKGIKLDGTNPTLLYAYGGFNISSLPGFSPTLLPWLEQGGVYAVANLRGGAEYGEKWHKAGMRLNKQNVFDDFIAAGEYLIKTKYTSSKRLALRGGSNGGLLVGAVINQRPDLAKVAIPQVGVMDMLRFHKFTIGWNWIAEYGSSDNAEDFKNLFAYSPLHNIKPGLNYPATLVTTADHDDRVVPAHSFKYMATLQENYKGENPVLIRIDTKSGHGASNTTKAMEQTADIYSFIFYNMNFTPKFKTAATQPATPKKGF